MYDKQDLRAPIPFDDLDIYDVMYPSDEDSLFLPITTTRSITGKIVDVNGEPIPATLNSIKDTSIWTESDFDGNFSLTAPVGHLIKISSVGFEPKQILVSSIGKIITLQYDNDNNLDTVDLGTISTNNPAPTPVIETPTSKAVKVNWWFVGIGLTLVATITGVYSASKKSRKPALAGGKKKNKANVKKRKKTTPKKRSSKKRSVKKKVKR